MKYEKDIFIVLQEAGDSGLSVRKIARHVLNARNSFFDTESKETISRAVQRYLTYHSRRSDDTVEKVGYATYRLNTRSKAVKELRLKFSDTNEEKTKKVEDRSLSLF